MRLATDRQRRYAVALLTERGVDVDSYVRRRFGRQLGELMGDELSVLIRELRSTNVRRRRSG